VEQLCQVTQAESQVFQASDKLAEREAVFQIEKIRSCTHFRPHGQVCHLAVKSEIRLEQIQVIKQKASEYLKFISGLYLAFFITLLKNCAQVYSTPPEAIGPGRIQIEACVQCALQGDLSAARPAPAFAHNSNNEIPAQEFNERRGHI
jgi:hypothetical protein